MNHNEWLWHCRELAEAERIGDADYAAVLRACLREEETRIAGYGRLLSASIAKSTH